MSTPVSSTKKYERHDMIEILLKVALNTTLLTLSTSEIKTNDHIWYMRFVAGPMNYVTRLFWDFMSSEWISVCICNTAIFQLYHGDNKLIFNEMMMRSALYQTNTRRWFFIVLAHWNNSPPIDMVPHSDTLFWFRANQFLLVLLNAVCLVEKQHIQIV